MKKNKKLELKKETISILDNVQARKVVGGTMLLTKVDYCSVTCGDACKSYLTTCPEGPCVPPTGL